VAETLNKRLAAKLEAESRENARRYWARKASTPFDPQRRRCDMGVGCEESSVCYAMAMGEPERCGRKEPPLYEARGFDIWKLPQERRVGDKTHISLGFKVCTVNRELLDETGAANLAQMLDYAERATGGPDGR
jgi:hypothetical protein